MDSLNKPEAIEALVLKGVQSKLARRIVPELKSMVDQTRDRIEQSKQRITKTDRLIEKLFCSFSQDENGEA
jgi:hypothetical protein